MWIRLQRSVPITFHHAIHPCKFRQICRPTPTMAYLGECVFNLCWRNTCSINLKLMHKHVIDLISHVSILKVSISPQRVASVVFFLKLPRGSGHGFGIIPNVYIWFEEGREQTRLEEWIQACPLPWKFLSSSCECICFHRFDPLFNEIRPSFIISACPSSLSLSCE